MARRSQCSDAGDNPLDPNYLPPHYKEEYRLAIDALIEEDLEGYYKFLQFVDVVDFLAPSEIDYIQSCIQIPKQSTHPEHRYLDTTGDGSSDTYWPMHSDLDAPGLDLGWPQIHHFIGPTEVTTLVNPAAPDMPSIKEQARRLIKNAQMVIAVVMDMFTDVDIFADILNATTRNVAVYLLLDEANVQYFINMVNNCRVNLQAIQFLRVRTVTGIRYHCRTGKTFKGQMLDRFILTDCRAVLSGNYSFMWSYEKLHRCMAHLFLGQLVSTFDEEFRILFAQSEPLDIKRFEDMTVLPNRPYLGDRPLLRDPRKYRTMDPGQPEEWNRPPYEENMDWRMGPLKRHETFQGPMDIYNRYPSPQSRLDVQTRLEPPFDQGPPRMMEGLPHKRHGFAEGGPSRYNLPYQQPQPGLPEVEPPGRPFYRGQQHLHPGHDPDYGGYGSMDKFWNQDFQQDEPYPEPGYPREIDPHENFDPVLNYLSSARNVEMEQSSDKLIPGPDLPYATTHPRRHIGQPYACQTSPTPSNTTEKRFMQDHPSDRKDPTVKRGLRNWRISSYLSAYDSSGEPEGLPMGQDQVVDPFDDMPHPMQQPTPPPPQAIELAVSKIPNVREFKVPALPRASQMPAFVKTTPKDLPKKFPDEIPQIIVPPVVQELKVPTPTPSESSSTTDGEKQEEVEIREPIASVLKRDDSFRGKYNAAMQRGSRLRSSLIFRSLDQSTQDNSEQDDDKAKTEADLTKLAFVSQRRSGTREPFEWRSYIKSSDNAKTEEDSGKQAEKDSESKSENQELAKTKEVAKSPQLASKDAVETAALPNIEQPPPQLLQPISLLSEPFLDMNDPDQRFLFFKELAAKRRAEKAAEEVKLKQKNATKEKKEELKKEETVQEEVVGSSSEMTKEDSKRTDAKTLDLSSKIENVDSEIKKEPTQSCDKIETKIATHLEKTELEQSQACKPASIGNLTQEKEASKEIDAPKPAEKQDQAKEANVASITANVDQVTEEKQPPTNTTDAASKDSQLKNSNSVQDSAKTFGLDLLSSLPSARIYERSLSQEASKEVTPKSRLWSPTIQRREFLKPFGDKQKSISSVTQIDEATEEANPTESDVASDASISQEKAKFEIGDKTATKQSAQTILKNKEKTLEKTESSSTENTKDAKEASPLQSVTPVVPEKTTVLPIIAENKEQLNKGESIKSISQSKEGAIEKSITSKQLPINEESLEKSSASSTQIKKDNKDGTSTAKCKTVLSNSNPSVSPFELLLQDKPKTEQKQSIESRNENSNVEQADSAQKSDKLKTTGLGELQPQEKIEEKSNIEDRDTKVTSPNEVVKTIEKPGESLLTSEKVSPQDTVKTSSKDGAKEVDSAATQEKLEMSAESNLSKNLSVISEKSSGTLPSDKTVQETPATADESKQKYPIFEEVTLLESHSNTSSPVSFATALEFISSEDSDFFSPDKNDPQNLFKTSHLESSVSDLSEFETPNSEISMSPMPSTVDMDDTFEDNASIAETVIEAPKRKAATAEEVKDGGENTSQKQASQKATVIESCEATETETAKSSENEKRADSAKSEKQVESTAQIAAVESSTTVATSKVDESKMADKASEMSTESSTKDASNVQSETSKKSISTEVKTQDVTGQAVSSATTEEKEETKMEDKPAEITVKNTSNSMEASKESRVDDKSSDPKISTIKSEAETCSTNQSIANLVSNVTKEAILETNTKKVYSRFQVEPSNASAETNANMVTSKVTEKVEKADTNSELKSDCTIETSLERKTEGIGQNLEASETKQGVNNENKVEIQASTTTQEAKTVEQTTEIITKDPSTPEENLVREKHDSKTVTPSNTDEVKEPETCKPAHMTNNDSKEDKENEIAPKDEKTESKTEILSSTSKTNQSTTSSTTSEMTLNANSDKETAIVNKEMSKSAGGENEQKSKDANDNTKENTSTSDSVQVIEIAPSTAQSKQQQKSRYLTSTANVISSSNLRDDTKILLEQISANSQTRNESNPAKEAPVTDEEKEDEADKNGKRKNDLRSSMGQQKTSQERDKLLERIQTMRKDRKVYSRFEV